MKQKKMTRKEKIAHGLPHRSKYADKTSRDASKEELTVTGRIVGQSVPNPQQVPIRTPEGERIRAPFLGRKS